jgi:hypothetical protein
MRGIDHDPTDHRFESATKGTAMKASILLFALLLAAQALPGGAGVAHAQAQASARAQREDDADGRLLRTYYHSVYLRASRMPAYSAEEVTETSKALADGNQIATRETSMRYRDAAGRVRWTHKRPDGTERIFIVDSAAQTAWLVRPDRKDVLRIQGTPSLPRYDDFPAHSSAPAWSRQVTTSLGVKDIAGVKAAGLRLETVYPAGAEGNEKELVEVTETWRSGELGEVVYTHTVSPRFGERTVRIDNVRFGDVPASMFAIPADYAVKDVVVDAAPGPVPAAQ